MHGLGLFAFTPTLLLRNVVEWPGGPITQPFDEGLGSLVRAAPIAPANRFARRQRLRAEVKSLRSVVNSLGHEQIDLLKLDIEGAEYEVIRSILTDEIPVNVLTVEFHKNPSTQSMRTAVADLRRARLFPEPVDGYEVAFVRSPLLPPARTSRCTPGRVRSQLRRR